MNREEGTGWFRPLATLPRRGIGVIAVLLDLATYGGGSIEEGPGSAAELAAVRHALSEYGIAHLVMHAGDDPERVLVTKERVRA